MAFDKNARLFWGTAVTVVVIDFVSKRLIERAYGLEPHVPHRVIGDVVRFTLAWNPGAAFSMYLGAHSGLIFGAFAVAAIFFLWRLSVQARPGDTARIIALALCSGGAAGNLLDRFRGPLGVVDFIDVGIGATRFWTFNAADSAVTIGAFMLAFVLWREDRAELATLAASADARHSTGGAPVPDEPPAT